MNKVGHETRTMHSTTDDSPTIFCCGSFSCCLCHTRVHATKTTRKSSSSQSAGTHSAFTYLHPTHHEGCTFVVVSEIPANTVVGFKPSVQTTWDDSSLLIRIVHITTRTCRVVVAASAAAVMAWWWYDLAVWMSAKKWLNKERLCQCWRVERV